MSSARAVPSSTQSKIRPSEAAVETHSGLFFCILRLTSCGVQYELATDYTAKEVPTFVDTVIGLFPSNLAAQWVNGEVVPETT